MTSSKIRFFTDSTCDIPPSLIAQYEIGVVPCYVNIGDKSYVDNGVELVREDFYRDMPTFEPKATTAAPPPAVAERIIRETFEGADHLFVICVSSKLSAVYNSMRLAISGLPEDRVTLIDSGMTTMGMGWQVLIGAETAAETGDVGAVKDAIARVQAHGKLFAGLNTLEYLRASGRVSWAAASIGTLLQIKPIVTVVDGEVVSAGRVRTFNRVIDQLAELVREQGPLDRLAVLHTMNEQGVQALLDRLDDILPADVLISTVTPVVGTHVGPGALAVAPLSKSWRN